MFYYYIIDLFSTLGRGGLAIRQSAEDLAFGFSKVAKLPLCEGGVRSNDGLDQFGIGFCVWDGGWRPGHIIPL